MPEIKISEFPELNTPILTDVIPILDLSETDPSLINKKVSIEDVLNLVPTPEVITASNLGLGEPIFDDKVVSDLQFKSLVAGTNIDLTSNLTNIVISNTAPLGEINTASNVGLGAFLFKQKDNLNLEFKSITAGAGINVTNNTNDINIINDAPGEYNTASNVGTGLGLFKSKVVADLQFKSLTAGSNISLVNNANDISINAPSPGEVNTASNVGTGVGLYKSKTVNNLDFKSLLVGAGLSISNGSNEVTLVNTSPGEVNTASNIGLGHGLYISKTGVNLDFKSLIAGSGVDITSTSTEITITNNTSTVSFSSILSTNLVLNNSYHNKFIQVNTVSASITITLSNSVQNGFTCLIFHNKGAGTNQININTNALTFLSRGLSIQNPAATASLMYNATTSTWYGIGDLI